MLEILITALFFSLVAVNAALLALFFSPRKKANSNFCPALSIIIPAHNEEKYIAATIRSVQSAEYRNKREIIVVDDGSTDKTASIVKKFAKKDGVRLFSIRHAGKSAAINFGMRKASFGTVAFLDADSSLGRKSLLELVRPLADRDVAISSGIIRARHAGLLSWFQDLDYIVSSGWRYACDKINGTYMAPGFAAFRKSALQEVGGFSKDTLTEDLDTPLVLRKAGYGAAMSSAVIFTSVPSGMKSLVRQRIRWGRGSVQNARKHFDVLFSRKPFGFYSFPMHLFWYPFALVYIPFALYWMLSTYASISAPVVSMATVMFFVKWLTVYGIADLFYNLLSGSYALTPLLLSIALSWALSFAYLVTAMKKFSAFSWRALSYVIIFPYYWLTFAIQGFALVYEALRVNQKNGNVWNKLGGNSV